MKKILFLTIILSIILTGCNLSTDYSETKNSIDFDQITKMINQYDYRSEEATFPEFEITRVSLSPLTHLIIYTVTSEKYQNENTVGKSITQFDHGGSYMGIITLEIGNALTDYAHFNGKAVKEIDRAIYDPNNDKVADGWIYLWDASGYESGTFEIQCTSLVSPRNTLRSRIYIK